MNDNSYRVIEVDINEILPNRFQPRIQFDEDEILELSDSIKEHGVIQPIVVRTIGDKYEIIAGERRYKASVLAGKETVPVIIKNLNDKDSAEIALIENIQRKNLTPIEEALSYKKILDMGYITQENLANKLGKSQSSVANKIRLLNLSDEVQEALLDNKISERHARSLLRLKSLTDQNSMLEKIVKERLTVRKTDEEIDRLLNLSMNEEINIEEKGDINMYNEMNQINPVASSGNPVDIFGTTSTPVNEPVQPSIPVMEPVIPEASNMSPIGMQTPVNEPVQPSVPVMEQVIPEVPNMAPIGMQTPVNEPAQPSVPVMEPVIPEVPNMAAIGMQTPVNEPAQPSVPVMEPPVNEPAQPSVPVMEPVIPEVPSMAPIGMQPPVNEPAQPSVPVMEPVIPEVPNMAPIGMQPPVNEPVQLGEENLNIPAIDTELNINNSNPFYVQNNETNDIPKTSPIIESNNFNPVDNSIESKKNVVELPEIANEFVAPQPIIITDYTKQYDPIMPDTFNEVETKVDFKEIINAIRECSQKIEKYGYKIDVEEYDLSTLYQVVFKIEK